MSDDSFHAGGETALVLGATGFIGRHVCRRLAAKGFSVRGLGHGDWTLEERRAHGVERWLSADITADSMHAVSEGAVPTVILHCAGSGAVSHSFSAPEIDYRRSVETTLAMLQFARAQSTGPRIVLASSAAVYGDRGDIDLTEDMARQPISPYGFHKAMAEMLCESYSRFFSLKTRVVRLFSVYGEGLRKQLLWDALNKFQRGTPSFFGTGDELRDWIHVEDAARLLVLAASPETSGNPSHAVFNGGHVRANTREVLTALAGAAKTPLMPVFSGETHVGNPRRLTGSHDHAHSGLGFRGAIGLQEGLQRYADWFKTEVAG
jgi:UDP-glucose 4-epimerase